MLLGYTAQPCPLYPTRKREKKKKKTKQKLFYRSKNCIQSIIIPTLC